MVELRDYQKKAVLWCRKNPKTILNMGCRTGKTLTALKAVNHHVVTVIGPPHLKEFWKAEFNRLSGRPYMIEYISSFDKKGLRECFRSKPECIIVDEAHERMSWDTSRTILEMCVKAQQVILLTATPVINDPLNLYWPLKICGKWSDSIDNFKLIFCGGQRLRSDPRIIYPTDPTNLESLKALVKEASYRYFRPEKVKKWRINLGEKPIGQASKIEDFATFQKIQGFLKVKNLKFLKVLKKNLDKNRKIGILFFHKQVGKILQKKLSNTYLIDGDVPIGKRAEIVKDFEACDKGFILLNYKSSGVGIDIKTVDTAIFAEATWSPAKDYQAYMRFYGYSRTKTLQVKYPTFTEEERLIVSRRKQDALSLLK